MTPTHQIALILPVAQRDAGNRIAEAMGWGTNNYSVPLLTDGTLTHYGLSAVCDEAFLATLSSAGEGVTPEGCAPEDIATVLPVLLMSVQPIDAMSQVDQFDGLCSEHGLARNVGGEV